MKLVKSTFSSLTPGSFVLLATFPGYSHVGDVEISNETWAALRPTPTVVTVALVHGTSLVLEQCRSS
jgi:hypothetical protein